MYKEKVIVNNFSRSTFFISWNLLLKLFTCCSRWKRTHDRVRGKKKERERLCVFNYHHHLLLLFSYSLRVFMYLKQQRDDAVHNIFIHRKASYLSFIFAVAALTTSSDTYYIHSQRERNMMIIITLHSRLITRL